MSEKIAENAKYQDLSARFGAAVALGLAALVLVSLGTIPTAIFVAIASVIMMRELSALVRAETDLSPLAGLGMMVIGPLAVMIAAWSPVIALAVILAGAALLIFLNDMRFGPITWAGFALIAVACVAAVSIRDGVAGFWILLWLILCVIGADAGGYFAGRSFGGPKLWPAVSPKKTWSGFIGGIVLSLIVSMVMAISLSGHIGTFLIFGLIIATVALGGDLLESAAKRYFGVKDSGSILPGHGGLLDRFDGLAAVMVLFLLLSATGSLAQILGIVGQ